MKKIHNIYLSLFLTAIYLLLLPAPITVKAQELPPPVSACADSQVTPFTDEIGWIYDTFNGVLYRRQYNYTKNCRIGEWEKV